MRVISQAERNVVLTRRWFSWQHLPEAAAQPTAELPKTKKTSTGLTMKIMGNVHQTMLEL
jgi:hypothetical protein